MRSTTRNIFFRLVASYMAWSAIGGIPVTGWALPDGKETCRVASAEAARKVEKFASMSSAELRAHEREAVRGVLDLELIPPVVETAPDQSTYGFAKLDFAMNGGMAQTPGGRLYAVWFAGADHCFHSEPLDVPWNDCFL